MSNPVLRFPITASEIDRVMQAFYTRVRAHPELGPVFNTHIGESDAEWEEHIVKIDSFWRNALLREPGYDGNPMRVHVASSDIKVAHFAPWLSMFQEVLEQELSEESAKAWGAMANRIAGGFTMHMEEARRPRSAPPKLI